RQPGCGRPASGRLARYPLSTFCAAFGSGITRSLLLLPKTCSVAAAGEKSPTLRPTTSPRRKPPWPSRVRTRLAGTTGATVTGQQLPVHPEPPVEFAGESEDTGGRKGDFESHLPLRGDVLVDAEGRDTQIVQRQRLALHEQRELLPRLA